MTVSVPVPDREMRVVDLLPLLHGVQDVVTLGIVRDVESRGWRISCKAGCGVCCRQPVPIAESEAVRLGELVAGMPGKRRARIHARFADAIRRIDRNGLLDDVRHAAIFDRKERMRVSGEYFRLGIACPFLEDESCSIYEHRPLRCREYLVTSPPENCAPGHPGKIDRPPMPPGPWSVIYRFEDGKGESEPSMMALVLAMEIAAARKERPMPRFSAPEMMRNLIAQLLLDTEGPGFHI
jgi:Fe-S-cluster containining protein